MIQEMELSAHSPLRFCSSLLDWALNIISCIACIRSLSLSLQMHFQPDLNLASSYIPGCLCILKCTFAFILFVFSPVRGWIGLCCLLTVDRILWNQSNASILDVNAVAIALVGGLMVMHTRADGIHTAAYMVVSAVWALANALQVVGLTRLNKSYEVLLGACSVTVLSCLYQAPERTEFLALRAFVFVVANTTLPYIGVMMQQQDIDTYVNACRTLLIILGELEVACGWVVVYILCMGYQLRSGSACPKRSRCSYTPEASTVVVIQSNMPPSLPSCEPTPDEAALLREALANRRGLRDN